MDHPEYEQNELFDGDAKYIIERPEYRIALVENIVASIEREVDSRIRSGDLAWNETDEREECWGSLRGVIVDIGHKYKEPKIQDNEKFNRILRDVKSGNSSGHVKILLPWYCWYDPAEARNFYKNSGLANRENEPEFREYVGEPGEWTRFRAVQANGQHRARAHGLELNAEHAIRSEAPSPRERVPPTGHSNGIEHDLESSSSVGITSEPDAAYISMAATHSYEVEAGIDPQASPSESNVTIEPVHGDSVDRQRNTGVVTLADKKYSESNIDIGRKNNGENKRNYFRYIIFFKKYFMIFFVLASILISILIYSIFNIRDKYEIKTIYGPERFDEYGISKDRGTCLFKYRSISNEDQKLVNAVEKEQFASFPMSILIENHDNNVEKFDVISNLYDQYIQRKQNLIVVSKPDKFGSCGDEMLISLSLILIRDRERIDHFIEQAVRSQNPNEFETFILPANGGGFRRINLGQTSDSKTRRPFTETVDLNSM